jgi:hypothetical protein
MEGVEGVKKTLLKLYYRNTVYKFRTHPPGPPPISRQVCSKEHVRRRGSGKGSSIRRVLRAAVAAT